jgi:hypothetical protein
MALLYQTMTQTVEDKDPTIRSIHDGDFVVAIDLSPSASDEDIHEVLLTKDEVQQIIDIYGNHK